LCEQEGGSEIDRHGLIPAVGRCVEERVDQSDAGIIDEDVDAAGVSECFTRCLVAAFDGPEISLDHQAFSRQCFDRGSCLFKPILIAANRNNIRTGIGQHLADIEADAL